MRYFRTSRFDTGDTQITIFYPLIGIVIMLCSFGFLVLGIRDARLQKSNENKNVSKKEESEKSKNPTSWNFKAFVGLFALFFFFYVGAEVCYGVYLTTFAVKSPLALTKQTGAEITAIFFGCFAAMRFISIFTAIYLSPIYIMLFSCVLSTIGGLILTMFGAQNVLVLQICSACLGFGTASVYATGILLLFTYIHRVSMY